MRRAFIGRVYFLLKVIVLTGALTYLVVSLVYLEKLPDGLSVPNDSSIPLYERIATDELEYRGTTVRLTAHLREGRWFQRGANDVLDLDLDDGYRLFVYLRQPLDTDLGPEALEISVIGKVQLVSRSWSESPAEVTTIIWIEDGVIEIEE